MEPSINPSLSLFLTLWFYSVATSSAALSFSNHVIPQKTNLRSEQPNNVITCVYLKGSQANIDSYNNSEYDRIDHRCQTFAEYEEDGQSEMVYELPDIVLSKLDVTKLISGIFVLEIVGAKIHRVP